MHVHPMQTRSKSSITKSKYPPPLSLFSSLCPETEASQFKEAFPKPQWQEAISYEFNVLMANDTWELIPYNSAQNLLAIKWVYRINRSLMVALRGTKLVWLLQQSSACSY